MIRTILIFSANWIKIIFVSSFRYLGLLANQSTQLSVNCQLFLLNLIEEGKPDFAIVNPGEVAQTLIKLSAQSPTKIKGIYSIHSEKIFGKYKIQPIEDLKFYTGPIVLETNQNIENTVRSLKTLGVEADQINIIF